MRGRSYKRHKQHSQHVQHVVHADGLVTTHHESTVSHPTHKSAAMQRKRLALVVFVALMAVLVFVGIRTFVGKGVQKGPSQPLAPTVVNQIVTESLDQLATENPSGLSATVDKINATEGSNTDPTLLYIKLRYYISIGDSVSARKTYNSLDKVYDEAVGYDPLINQSARSMQGLKADVEFLEKQAEQVRKNSWGATDQ